MADGERYGAGSVLQPEYVQTKELHPTRTPGSL